jgi:hypothetical protein
MTKVPSESYCKKIKKMSNGDLVALLAEQSKQMAALEKERMDCWNRMIAIHELEDVLGGKRQMVAITCRARNIT